MDRQHLPHQPTLRHLLNSEAMAEAQVVYGQDLLEVPVVQVVTALAQSPRQGTLYIARLGDLGKDAHGGLDSLSELSGLIVVKPFERPAESVAHGGGAGMPAASVSLDVEMQRLVKLCADAEVPLIVMSVYGEHAQVAEDIRLAFLGELKRASARMHASLLSLVLSGGLNAVAEELSAWLNRPVAVETADFKILAAKNMGPTPPSQQRTITEEVAESLNRRLRAQETRSSEHVTLKPFRIGRRLVMPILLDEVVAGYISAMVRPTDDVEAFGEHMHPAALACMVDFSQRRRDVSTFTATQKTLLKDLLSGRSLSAPDQERLDQSFGFDLCAALFVFAVQVASHAGRTVQWPEEPYASTEVEGTRVFVVPHDRKSGKSWQQEAEALTAILKKSTPDLKVQLGAGRVTESTLDLPDSYREARQALIIGSMIHGDNEFSLGYGDLGVKRLLYLMIDHPELERFYEENLAPLEAYDAEWETELVPTLGDYLKAGANLNSAARALFIHRHTLRYRLEQIADILKVDIDSQEVLLNLQIAFLIKEMKGKAQA